MHKILDQSHPPILTASLQKINMKKNNINCNGNEYNLHAVILAASDQILIAEKQEALLIRKGSNTSSLILQRQCDSLELSQNKEET